ncbi:hypothetical protein KBA73_03835 [Patescibacteria group bacterium]|nr:hypothetical protein [Patescibacteria group bacterium]
MDELNEIPNATGPLPFDHTWVEVINNVDVSYSRPLTYESLESIFTGPGSVTHLFRDATWSVDPLTVIDPDTTRRAMAIVRIDDDDSRFTVDFLARRVLADNSTPTNRVPRLFRVVTRSEALSYYLAHRDDLADYECLLVCGELATSPTTSQYFTTLEVRHDGRHCFGHVLAGSQLLKGYHVLLVEMSPLECGKS